MLSSRIDCVNIRKSNCEFYNENRLCLDDCVGFRSVDTTNQNTESIIIEPIIENVISSENIPVEDKMPKKKRG